MNNEEEFERRLQNHPQRRVPASWRADILNAARAGQTRQDPPLQNRAATADVISWLRGLLWPAPRAWAGLAAVWLVVVALNVGSREGPRVESANRALPPSPEVQEMLREQEKLFAELAGPRATREATRSPMSQPRSERRQEYVTA